MSHKNNIKKKQEEFNQAMSSYHDKNYYNVIYLMVSTFNVTLQITLFTLLFSMNIEFYWYVIIGFIAYYMTDLINGLVHMYMDNNAEYKTIWGPFIASFHLHHKTPKYQDKSILLIYFFESGPKFWLVPYLSAVLIFTLLGINEIISNFLIFVGILSSVAEVSHYLCHNSNKPWVKVLQVMGLLLSKEHHNHHHKFDNKNYAFLNGMSDPLINIIAKKFYGGYVHGTDMHYQFYVGSDTKNR